LEFFQGKFFQKKNKSLKKQKNYPRGGAWIFVWGKLKKKNLLSFFLSKGKLARFRV